MSIKIGQASLGETGGRNQQPGNQTGRELNISNWYNGRWLGILRYKSRKRPSGPRRRARRPLRTGTSATTWTTGTRRMRQPEPSDGT